MGHRPALSCCQAHMVGICSTLSPPMLIRVIVCPLGQGPVLSLTVSSPPLSFSLSSPFPFPVHGMGGAEVGMPPGHGGGRIQQPLRRREPLSCPWSWDACLKCAFGLMRYGLFCADCSPSRAQAATSGFHGDRVAASSSPSQEFSGPDQKKAHSSGASQGPEKVHTGVMAELTPKPLTQALRRRALTHLCPTDPSCHLVAIGSSHPPALLEREGASPAKLREPTTVKGRLRLHAQ